MSEQETPIKGARSVIRRHNGPSAVWLLPLIAALIAGWLVYKSYEDRGTSIEVEFSSAEGLEEDKTRIVYKGLTSGVVKKLKLSPDQKKVIAQIEINPEAEDLLHKDTQFWLVKPQISLSGVSGLETLVSGYYIGLKPGSSDEYASHFEAQADQPPPSRDEDGLYITLFADTASKFHRGSPVYYRDLEVGSVQDYKLTEKGDQITVDIFIQPQYAHLVRKHSRFWNASPISLKGQFPNLKVSVSSFATMLAGGIHFYTPKTEEEVPDAVDGDQFYLYADYDAAEDGVPVTLHFEGTATVTAGMDVMSRGIKIGEVQKVNLNDELNTLNAQLLIDPRARSFLRKNTRFWIVTPHIDTEHLNISKLMRGNHIEMDPGAGRETFEFTALDLPPSNPPINSGFQVQLRADSLGSISRGSPVLYRELPIGRVNGYELSADGEHVDIFLAIQEKYRELINSSSRFWNSSGIHVNASIEGLELQTGTAQTLLRGGISLLTLNKKAQPVDDNKRFTLYENYDDATDNGRLQARTENDLVIKLTTANANSISVGAPLLYRNFQIGRVSSYALAKDGQTINIEATVDNRYRHLINTNSYFWNTSGISAKVNLQQGLKLQTGSMTSLLKGGIAVCETCSGKSVKNSHRFPLYQSKEDAQNQPIQVRINFPAGPELPDNAGIFYQGQLIGQVDHIELSGEQGSRIVEAHINRDASFLTRSNTQFWISRAKIRLSGIENPSNLLFGNHIEVAAGTGKYTNTTDFVGMRQAPAYRFKEGLTVELHTDNLGSINIGSPVVYRGVPVGEVTGYDLSLDGRLVTVFAHIAPRFSTLVRRSSIFYNVSGVDADAGLFKGVSVKLSSLETIVGGGIAFETPDLNAPAVKERTVFNIQSTAPDKQ